MTSSVRFLSSTILYLWLLTCCSGEFQPLISGGAQDCEDLKMAGVTKSGVYMVFPSDGKRPVHVACDQETDGGGWLVIQRRQDGSVNFYRNWDAYLNGFGNLSREFWLGNENIHRLTNQRPYELRIDLEDFENNTRFAVYDYFSIGPVTDYYRLFVIGYHGNAGDGFSSHHGYQFSAKDLDKDTSNTSSCATQCKGGWWYKSCHDSNLNGLYIKGKHSTNGIGVNWHAWKGGYYSYKIAEMKIRPMKNLLTA